MISPAQNPSHRRFFYFDKGAEGERARVVSGEGVRRGHERHDSRGMSEGVARAWQSRVSVFEIGTFLYYQKKKTTTIKSWTSIDPDSACPCTNTPSQS